jgi:Ammonium Transporter Family
MQLHGARAGLLGTAGVAPSLVALHAPGSRWSICLACSPGSCAPRGGRRELRPACALRTPSALLPCVQCRECVQPWAAIIIGATAGGVYVFASWFVLHVLRVDDPLDAVAVHCFCGAWGLLTVSAFAHGPNVRAAYGDAVADSGHGALPGL